MKKHEYIAIEVTFTRLYVYEKALHSDEQLIQEFFIKHKLANRHAYRDSGAVANSDKFVSAKVVKI